MLLRVAASRRFHPLRGPVFALAVGIALATPASSRAQDTTILECNERVALTATPRFDPPVTGPLQYEWRDGTGRVLGTEPALERAFPVGQFELALRASADAGRTAVARIAIEVRDTLPPDVRTLSRSLEIDAATIGTAGFDLFRAVGFSARDQCDPRPRLRVEPPGPYAAGTITVRLSASDAAGNTAGVSLPLTVTASSSPGGTAAQDGRSGSAGARARGTPGTTVESSPSPGPARTPSGNGSVVPSGSQAEAPSERGPLQALPAGEQSSAGAAGRSPATPGGGTGTSLPPPTPAGAADAGARAGDSATLPRERGTPSDDPSIVTSRTATDGSTAGAAPVLSFIGLLGSLVGISLVLVAVVLVTRRKRRATADPPPPLLPAPGTLRTRTIRAAIDHEIVLFDGFPQPRLAVRFRPRPEPGEALVDAVDGVAASEARE